MNGQTALELLAAMDRPAYVACLYLPEHAREPIAALKGFERETRRIRRLVSEPMPGEIRLQWWRDVLSGERRAEGTANPLAAALLAAVDQYGLSAPLLERLADARIFDLYDDPMPTVSDLEAYCGQTWSTAVQMSCQVLRQGEPLPDGTAAGHAGCALGFAWILESLAEHRRKGQMFVPLEIASACGLDREAFLADPDRARSDALVDAMCGLASDHLVAASKAISELDKDARIAFADLALAALSIRRAKAKGGQLLHFPLTEAPLRQHLATMRFALGW